MIFQKAKLEKIPKLSLDNIMYTIECLNELNKLQDYQISHSVLEYFIIKAFLHNSKKKTFKEEIVSDKKTEFVREEFVIEDKINKENSEYKSTTEIRFKGEDLPKQEPIKEEPKPPLEIKRRRAVTI